MRAAMTGRVASDRGSSMHVMTSGISEVRSNRRIGIWMARGLLGMQVES